MANVTVDSTANLDQGNRACIRSGNNFVYAFVNDSGTIRAYKGNVAGEPASFAEQDGGAANQPSNTDFVSVAIAIKSNGIIGVSWYNEDPAAHGSSEAVMYAEFSTESAAANQDTWSFAPEDVAALTNAEGTFLAKPTASIAIDTNDDVHVAWTDTISDMGSPATVFFYSNKIGGSWKARVVVTAPGGTTTANDMDLMIAEPTSAIGADRPIIIAGVLAANGIEACHGDALDATSFTVTSDITSPIEPRSFTALREKGQSCAIDTNGKIAVAFTNQSTQDLDIVEHLASNVWGTWETPVVVDSVNNYRTSNIAINGTNRYVFGTDTVTIRLWKDEGSGFTEETADPDLPNSGELPKAKWSNYVNKSPREIDYLFKSGTSVLYNTFQGAALGAAIVKIADEILDHVESPVKVLGFIKFGNEILDHVETSISKVELRRIADEILDHAEGAIPVLALVRIGSDILDHIETSISKVKLRRIANEIKDMIETPVKIIGFNKIGSDILDHVESALSILGIVKIGTEQLDHVETANKIIGLNKIVDEILDHIEAAISKVEIRKISNEILDHVETAISKVEIRKISNEILDHVETSIKIIGLNKIGSDILDHIETSISKVELRRISNEILDHIETSISKVEIRKISNEILEHVEATVKILGFNKIANEILDHIETSISKVELRRISNEILDHVESALAVKGIVRIANEILDHIETAIQKITAAAITALFGRRSLDKPTTMDKG